MGQGGLFAELVLADSLALGNHVLLVVLDGNESVATVLFLVVLFQEVAVHADHFLAKGAVEFIDLGVSVAVAIESLHFLVDVLDQVWILQQPPVVQVQHVLLIVVRLNVHTSRTLRYFRRPFVIRVVSEVVQTRIVHRIREVVPRQDRLVSTVRSRDVVQVLHVGDHALVHSLVLWLDETLVLRQRLLLLHQLVLQHLVLLHQVVDGLGVLQGRVLVLGETEHVALVSHHSQVAARLSRIRRTHRPVIQRHVHLLALNLALILALVLNLHRVVIDETAFKTLLVAGFLAHVLDSLTLPDFVDNIVIFREVGLVECEHLVDVPVLFGEVLVEVRLRLAAGTLDLVDGLFLDLSIDLRFLSHCLHVLQRTQHAQHVFADQTQILVFR